MKLNPINLSSPPSSSLTLSSCVRSDHDEHIKCHPKSSHCRQYIMSLRPTAPHIVSLHYRVPNIHKTFLSWVCSRLRSITNKLTLELVFFHWRWMNVGWIVLEGIIEAEISGVWVMHDAAGSVARSILLSFFLVGTMWRLVDFVGLCVPTCTISIYSLQCFFCYSTWIKFF